VTANYVCGLEVVLADGSHLWLGGEALDPPEYDFAGLLTGSEGTLALVTAARLRLRRPPQGIKALTASFDRVAAAGEAVAAVIAAGLLPGTIELMDRNMINAVEDYLQCGLPRQAEAMLIIDVEGYPDSLDEQLDQVSAILQRFGPLEIKIARSAEERELIWRGRRSAAGATARISPADYTLDVSVLRSRLAQALSEITAIAERYGLRRTFLAHAGDGNLHPSLCYDPAAPQQVENVHQAAAEILHLCAGMGGSIGAEHGTGIEKRNFLPLMYSPAEIRAMQNVKQVFDPDGLLNPGKIFPDQAALASAIPASGSGSEFFQSLPGKTAPQSAEQVAEILAAAQEQRQAVYVTGAGSQWRGELPQGVHLSTQALSGVTLISTADQYVVVRAGTPLAELQTALEESGFWAAAASPFANTSLGGLVSGNFNAPLRALYGSLRDQVLAVQVALADGRLLRFGRPLVKDVAGYSMNKLFCGAFGSLGVLTEITMKIHPRPLERRTLVAPVDDLESGLAWGLAVLRQATICSGALLCADDSGSRAGALYYTVEGHPRDVRAELSLVRKTLAVAGAGSIEERVDLTASQVWTEALVESAFLVRLGVAPGRLPELTRRGAERWLIGRWVLDCANGMLYLPLPGNDPPRNLALLKTCQADAQMLGGYALMASGPRRLLAQGQTWGTPRSSGGLMRRLKLEWDAADVLNRYEQNF
jgi:D-lactate dehydrogenase (cytochrome)